ncbi:MAG: quinolinate synthase NadA [Candidatus Hodarchaeales archaeon]|jgi:quinolinate synthase
MSETTQYPIPTFSSDEIDNEASRLHKVLSHLGWNLEICKDIAPLTLEINYLKKKRNIVILAHSYQTPDIIFGISDFKGDSYYLSKVAQNVEADILFAGVHFMAETAKILNPQKTVLISDTNAGCSLSESITGEDIKKLKEKHPGIPVVTYINTSAEVKAESDIIVTSANAPQILKALETKKVIFLPDKYMALNLKNSFPDIEFITWEGVCIVHEEFTGEKVHFYRKEFGEDLHILVHTECAPEVVSEADMAGGTGDMIRFIESNPNATRLMLVTECGLVDRLRIEYPDREFVGTCNLCPYMKRINLFNILETLRNPLPENIIEVPVALRKRAHQALKRMFELTEKK